MTRLTTRLLIALLFGALGSPGIAAAQTSATPRPSGADPLLSVLGAERSNELDAIVARSGDILSGSVVDPSFRLTTAVGPVELPAATVAGFDFSDRTSGIVRAHLVNGNVLSGFLDVTTLDVVLSSGIATQMSIELLDSVVFAIRHGERRDLPLGHAIVLSNGDVVTAAMGLDELTISTNEGVFPLPLAALRTLEFRMHEGRLVLATARLTDGRTLEGVVSPARLDFSLDTGGQLALHQSRIQTLYASAGTPLEQLGLVSSRREYTGELSADDAVWINGRYADEYTFFVREGSTVIVDMTVDSFDNFVQLESPSGRDWQNDDHGSTRRSYLEVTADATGLWRARATSLGGGQMGSYRLVLEVQ